MLLQMNSIQVELDKCQLSLSQEKNLAAGLKSQLQEAREQLEQKTDALNETCSDEIVQLHSQLHSLQSDKVSSNGKHRELLRWAILLVIVNLCSKS